MAQPILIKTLRSLRAVLQWLGLTAGFGLVGWVLAAFSAPAGIWLGTALVMVYLLSVGRGGVLPATIWISLLITLAIGLDLIPPFWPQGLPYRYWARTLILLWAAAMVLVYLLGRHGDSLRACAPGLRWKLQAASLGVMGLGVGLGQVFYHS